MNKKTCAITGATGGIGAALAQYALSEGYDLILHSRSKLKLRKLIETLKRETQEARIEPVVGDLESAEATKKVSAEIATLAPTLNLLFNNAGVLLDGIQISPDNLELHTQVNLIAPYILMETLKINLARANGTIINVSSGTVLRAKSLSIETLQRPAQSKKLFGAYAMSKLALSVVTNALGNEYAAEGVTLASVDPGPNKTNMTAGAGMPFFLLILRPFFYSAPEKGAKSLFEAYQLSRNYPPGTFFSKGKARSFPAFTQDPSTIENLLEFCRVSADFSTA